jgi:hypothetical protein
MKEKKESKQVTDADDLIRDYIAGEETQKAEGVADVRDEFAEAQDLGNGPQITQRPERRSPQADVFGGDVDAGDAGTTIGEEAVGGSNPTPDQDIVDEIGKGAGVTYEDDEPLRPGGKLEERDTNRWELDPASSEDYHERMRLENDLAEEQSRGTEARTPKKSDSPKAGSQRHQR